MKWLVLGLMMTACEHGKGGGMVPLDGGSGVVCGGLAGASCAADEWCDFPQDDCGGDVSAVGSCRLEPGFFQCGTKQCLIDAELCQHSLSDTGGPDSFACSPLP